MLATASTYCIDRQGKIHGTKQAYYLQLSDNAATFLLRHVINLQLNCRTFESFNASASLVSAILLDPESHRITEGYQHKKAGISPVSSILKLKKEDYNV